MTAKRINAFKKCCGSEGRVRLSLLCPLPQFVRAEAISSGPERRTCRLKGNGSPLVPQVRKLLFLIYLFYFYSSKTTIITTNKTQINNWHRKRESCVPGNLKDTLTLLCSKKNSIYSPLPSRYLQLTLMILLPLSKIFPYMTLFSLLAKVET